MTETEIDYSEKWLSELKAIHTHMDEGLLQHIVKLYQASPSAFSSFCDEMREDPQKFKSKDLDPQDLKYESTKEDLIQFEQEMLERQNQEKLSMLLEQNEIDEPEPELD